MDEFLFSYLFLWNNGIYFVEFVGMDVVDDFEYYIFFNLFFEKKGINNG